MHTRVHNKFKLVVVVDSEEAHRGLIPIPFLNRFEKQLAQRRDWIVDEVGETNVKRLEGRVDRLLSPRCDQRAATVSVALPGRVQDTVASAIAATRDLDAAFEAILLSATPEAAVQLRDVDKEAFDLYFEKQVHVNLRDTLSSLKSDSLNIFVRTFCLEMPPRELKQSLCCEDLSEGDRSLASEDEILVLSLRNFASQLEFERCLQVFFTCGSKQLLLVTRLDLILWNYG